MLKTGGHYRDWASIDYTPVLPAHHPASLLAVLPCTASVLEIGCNEGLVSCHLARKFPLATIHGIDLNPAAIAAAQQYAMQACLSNVQFEIGDALQATGSWDAVIAIRVLTCFPAREDWLALLESMRRLLRPHGFICIIDYLFDPLNPAYAARYAAGELEGMSRGSFRVNAASGEPTFVAHHHTDEEITCMTRRFTTIRFRRFESLSMHGNRASMFEFLGRREQDAL